MDEVNNVKPIPFVVDNIFNQEIMKLRRLNLSLSEEIVANISFSTYILLDTLSTSMELGLFSNNNQNNQIKVLFPNDRINPAIGGFIMESIRSRSDSVDIWNYNGEYYEDDSSKNMFTYFENNIIPDNLKDKIDENIKDLIDNQLFKEVIFTKEDNSTDFSNIIYKYKKDKIMFNINTKLLFYLVLSKKEIRKIDFEKKEITSEYLDDIKKFVKLEIFKMFIKNNNESDDLKSKIILSNDLDKIVLKTNLGRTFEQTLNHILNIIQIIVTETTKGNGKQTLSRSSYPPVFKESYSILRYDNIFNLNDKDEILIQSYYKDFKKYINKFKITINKSDKTIETYANNKYGLALRKYHEKVNCYLNEIPLNESVVAYKEGLSTKDVLIRHLVNNNFSKKDIKSYFNSIKWSIFINVLSDKLDKNIFNIKIDKNNLKTYLKGLFLNNRLPIGFVTSPVISNIYLTNFDEEISEYSKEKNIVYTRYSDDILISNNHPNLNNRDLILTNHMINTLLEDYDLKTNTKKTLSQQLDKNGDYIRYLGINIVRKNSSNKLTISNSYLRKAAKENLKFGNNHVKTIGKARYIKHISEECYDKYLNIISIWKYERKTNR